ncbi:DUF732 domain-containing protein [Mycolicibacterium anyangense]|uniref:DUF732 domain-containing protein n=1 Tax=Mycolicibacterium anyangense TaxID=1431246 RepID=UPI0013D771EF|nr:DUF732 domain-containing protein [Mycolicibacterium anyangense]
MTIVSATTARLLVVGAAAVGTALAGLAGAPTASADSVGYLVNVTVRPGYNFPNADAALSYGYGLCDQIAAGTSFTQMVNTVKTDFNTGDDFQATYLLSQASQELCPAQIWQLRKSAAGWVPSAQ